MDWHSLSLKEVFEQLKSSKQGLDSKKASERLSDLGPNKLKKTRHFDAIKIFFEQFKSFLIIILIFAAILSFFMESKIDAIVIFAIIILNAGLGFFQEYKAEKAITELNKMMTPKARVFRNGRVVEINSENIVPGDIIILDEGDKVMADARLIETNGLKINEAALTGESSPEEKEIKNLSPNTPLGDRLNMIYQGTQVVAGSGRAIVVDTGMRTEIGKISELVQEIKPEKNPFKHKLDVFARNIGIIILGICALIILLMIFKGFTILKSLLVAISLAVAAIPEGLPAVISLSLALATRRMIKKNVLVRKLPASETLGRATVICVDKTGTLTEEEMKVTSIYTNGKFNPIKQKELLFKIGVLCNKANLEEDEKGKEYFLGDPTEIALLKSAKENFLNKKQLEKQEPKQKEFPFNSERKMMSIIRKKQDRLISYVKGAPEKIIQKCDYELIDGRKIELDEKDKIRLTEKFEKMASEGLRVLGFAYRELSEEYNQEIAENNLIFAGFQGMIDPPRKEVKSAIEKANQAGIKVIMITGDSKLTAEAVAKEIGLKGGSIESKELEKMSDKELLEKINKTSVFSRISPKDKLRIINILKSKKEIVAMTGDGVNDSLALKRADIGIAMGTRGTDVARDSSDLILVDDNFASIVEGVDEGRTIFDNIKKFVKFLLSANFSEVLLIMTVMLIWKDPHFLPLLPIQILWINLVTDSLPALSLSTEETERDVMKRKPSKKGILNGTKKFIIIAGLLTALINFAFFYFYLSDITKARTMAVTSAILFQMFLVFNCKSTKYSFKSPFNKYILYAVLFSIGMQIIAIYTPLNELLYFTGIGFIDWIYLISISIIGFFLIEGWKYLENKKLL